MSKLNSDRNFALTDEMSAGWPPGSGSCSTTWPNRPVKPKRVQPPPESIWDWSRAIVEDDRPRILPKHARRVEGFDENIISLLRQRPHNLGDRRAPGRALRHHGVARADHEGHRQGRRRARPLAEPASGPVYPISFVDAIYVMILTDRSRTGRSMSCSVSTARSESADSTVSTVVTEVTQGRARLVSADLPDHVLQRVQRPSAWFGATDAGAAGSGGPAARRRDSAKATRRR
jgi:hypothetical protein